MQYLEIILGVSILILCILILISVRRRGGEQADAQRLSHMEESLLRELYALRGENQRGVQDSVRGLGEMLVSSQNQTGGIQDKRLRDLSEQLGARMDALSRVLSTSLAQADERQHASALQNEQKLEHIRMTMEQRLTVLGEENTRQLDKMRETVDEKLQKTLEDRIGQSFKLVSERLEQVYRGLGEMQTLAVGVGDLKKVLSNVKTRGILGEIQLGSILEQILNPEQYETNVITKKNTQNPVEYAVRMPGGDGDAVYLPIDAKFPADAYAQLMDAYDSADPAAVEAAGKTLTNAIRSFAKDIRDKYIDPPNTTDFGVMFLPFEGLYAEAVRRGMVEVLARDYKVSIAGPTTMAALLNSLQMGFRTLAIQKRSSEVWRVLGAVKTEFDKFGDVLSATQKRLEQANSELDKLVGVRTRQMKSKLRTVTLLPEEEARALLADAVEDAPDDAV